MGREEERGHPVVAQGRLAERVGTERARAWVTTGATLDAAEAAAAGLASRVADASADDSPIDWRAEAFADAPALDRETLAAIRAASRPAGGPGGDALADTDLAALVRSAARPGLKARIVAYRERSKPPATRTDRDAPPPPRG